MLWFAVFIAVAVALAAYRVALGVMVVRAQRAGDTAREARLAARAFELRVGWIGTSLLVLVVILVVGLVRR